MAEMNKINSFKSFSEIKNAEKANRLREENQAKRKQLSQKFESLLDELGITSYEELDEETKKSFLSKLLGEEISEGNAFGNAVRKAKEAGEKEFEFEGETYKVEEGNAFIFAAAKAKAEGKDSFEFNGKTYKVTLKKDTGLKESYQLLVTEGTRSQFGKIDKTGKITSVYVHNDGYPEHMVNTVKKYKAKDVDTILNLGKAGISFLDKEIGDKHDFNNPKKGWTIFYGRDREETGDMTSKGEVKNIKNYLKDVANDAGAEYVYLYDERIAKWVGADTYTDKALKPIEQLEESVVIEAKAWEIGKDYPSYGVVVGIKHDGDLCEVSFDSGENIVFRDTGAGWVQESVVNEGEILVFDEIGQELEALKNKISGLMKKATDKKWVSALGSAHSALSNLDMKLSQADSKLGVIITESVTSDLNQLAKDSKDFKDFVKNFNKGYKIPASKALEVYLKTVYDDVTNESVNETAITYGIEYKSSKKDIKFKKASLTKTTHNPDIDKMMIKAISKDAKLLAKQDGWVDYRITKNGVPVNESAVTESKYDKKSLLKALGNQDDGIILVKGKEYIIYNPDNNNDENTAMWGDKTIFALDQDGEEYEFKYSDIERFSESVVNEAEIKSDDEFKEYAFTVLKKAFGDDFDEAKGQDVVDGILSKSDGDYGAAVGMLTSSLG